MGPVLVLIGLVGLYVVVKVVTHYVQKIRDENLMLRMHQEADRRAREVAE